MNKNYRTFIMMIAYLDNWVVDEDRGNFCVTIDGKEIIIDAEVIRFGEKEDNAKPSTDEGIDEFFSGITVEEYTLKAIKSAAIVAADTWPIERIDGVRVMDTYGEVKVINICALLDVILPDWMRGLHDYDEQGAVIVEWAKKNGAYIYSRCREDFHIGSAVTEAIADGKKVVIIEDMS